MRITTLATAGATSLAVALALLVAPGSGGPAAAEGGGEAHSFSDESFAAARAAAARVVLDARTGRLTTRVPDGLGSGARRLTSATVRQDLLRDRVTGTFVLDAEPTGIGTESQLLVGFGHVEDGTCYGDLERSTITWGAMSAGFARSGRTITMSIAADEAGYETWDCAFAVLDLDLEDPAPITIRSVLLGDLVDVPAKPKLSLRAPEVLGRAVARLPLVRNTWTVVTVPIRNTGRVDANAVVLRGAGRGLRVQGTKVATVYDDGTTSARILVKRVRAKAGPLRLVAKPSNAPGVRRTVATRAVRPAARPLPGRYANRAGTITFRITGARKVVGFRNYTRTTCGGYPDGFPTYPMNTYDFPTTGIARNGVLDRIQRARLYTVSLRLRATGTTVTSGRFSYSGPNRCFAVDTFKARRVGR